MAKIGIEKIVIRNCKAGNMIMTLSIHRDEAELLKEWGFEFKDFPQQLNDEYDKNRYSCTVSCKHPKPGTKAAHFKGIARKARRASKERSNDQRIQKQRSEKTSDRKNQLKMMAKTA